MGAVGRALVAFAVLVMAGCGTTVESIKSSGSYVPWQPLPAAHQHVDAPMKGPTAPLAIPAGTPACLGSQLEGVALQVGFGLGNVDMPVLLRNRSDAACFLDGYPDLTVLDRAGRTIGRSAGERDRGTYFSEIDATPVFMPIATPPLPAQEVNRADAPLGQAYIDISWYDSNSPTAGKLAIDLPDGGGRMVMRYTRKGTTNPGCQAPGQVCHELLRGPITASGALSVAVPNYQKVALSLYAPAGGKRGTVITYFVTITNESASAYVLTPCPDFTESLGGKQFDATYQLDCSPVGEIAPGHSVSFEMRYEIPLTADVGRSAICWDLADGRLESGIACADIWIS